MTHVSIGQRHVFVRVKVLDPCAVVCRCHVEPSEFFRLGRVLSYQHRDIALIIEVGSVLQQADDNFTARKAVRLVTTVLRAVAEPATGRIPERVRDTDKCLRNRQSAFDRHARRYVR